MSPPSIHAALRQQLAAGLVTLPDKPEETIDSTLAALWRCAAGNPCAAEQACNTPLPELTATQQQTLHAFIEQRLSGVPLAHLTGRQQFMGMEMLAGPDALVPRKETELLARAAIECCAPQPSGLRVVDVCTGSGNVALAIAQHVSSANVFGADLSDSAVALARRNAQHLGLEKRAEFRAGDLLAPFDTAEFHEQVDVLTCNPPYIASAKVAHMAGEISAHEPSLAFDGGPFGIAILMRLLQDAPRFLRSGGWLAFEVGLGQGPALLKRLEKMPTLGELRTVADDAGAIRVIVARRV